MLSPSGSRKSRKARPAFVSGLVTQARVIRALLLRELHSRYGRENIGWLWLFGEPMLLAGVVSLIHSTQATHYSSDIAAAPFAIVGYCTFIIFRGVFNRAESLIQGNENLLYHSRVTLLDIVLSTTALEIAGCAIAMTVLLTIAYALGLSDLPARPLYLFSAIALMGWWSFGLMMIAASFAYKNHLISRQIHVISYFSIPLSGMMFELGGVPKPIRDILQWFPMPLILEQARYGMFAAGPETYVSPGYVSAWCLGLTYAGMVLVNRLRDRIHVH